MVREKPVLYRWIHSASPLDEGFNGANHAWSVPQDSDEKETSACFAASPISNSGPSRKSFGTRSQHFEREQLLRYYRVATALRSDRLLMKR